MKIKNGTTERKLLKQIERMPRTEKVKLLQRYGYTVHDEDDAWVNEALHTACMVLFEDLIVPEGVTRIVIDVPKERCPYKRSRNLSLILSAVAVIACFLVSRQFVWILMLSLPLAGGCQIVLGEAFKQQLRGEA